MNNLYLTQKEINAIELKQYKKDSKNNLGELYDKEQFLHITIVEDDVDNFYNVFAENNTKFINFDNFDKYKINGGGICNKYYNKLSKEWLVFYNMFQHFTNKFTNKIEVESESPGISSANNYNKQKLKHLYRIYFKFNKLFYIYTNLT